MMSPSIHASPSFSDLPPLPADSGGYGSVRVDNKITSVALQALAYLALSVYMVLATVTVVIPLWALAQRVRSHYRMQPTIKALAQQRLDAVQKAVEGWTGTSNQDIPLNCQDDEFRTLKKKVDKMIQMIETCPRDGGSVHKDTQEIRAYLSAILELPVYQRNRMSKKHPYIAVLQQVAHAFVSESPGMGPMRQLGEQALGKKLNTSGTISYQTLLTHLNEAYRTYTTFKRATLLGKLLWIYAHPMKFVAGACDEVGITHPLDYNAFARGNASVHVGTFECKKQNQAPATYSLSQSPTFVSDKLTEADRDFGAKRIIQDLEADYLGKPGESGRLAEKGRICQKGNFLCDDLNDLDATYNNIQYFNTPINYKNNKHKRPFASDSKLAGILDGVFTDSKLDPKSKEKARLLAEAGLYAIDTMVNQRPFGPGKHYINQSCKQNIDRGVIVNVITILFADMISDTPITPARVQEIVGMVLARAGMVDDRAILKHWLNPLLNLLQILAQHSDFASKLQMHFGYQAIAFKASAQ